MKAFGVALQFGLERWRYSPPHQQQCLRRRGFGFAGRTKDAVRAADGRKNGPLADAAGRRRGIPDHPLRRRGAFYLADNRPLILRAWKSADRASPAAFRCRNEKFIDKE